MCNFTAGQEPQDANGPGAQMQGGRQPGYALVAVSWRKQEWGSNRVFWKEMC